VRRTIGSDFQIKGPLGSVNLLKKGILSPYLSTFGSPGISVADPKQKFRIRFGIRIRPAVSFESDPDPNPDSNPGFGSGSESWIRIRIRNWPKLTLFVLNFYAASSSNIKSLPSLSSVTWLRTTCAINFQSTRISHIYVFCMCIGPPPHPCQ
jgi:hypothetical protein